MLGDLILQFKSSLGLLPHSRTKQDVAFFSSFSFIHSVIHLLCSLYTYLKESISFCIKQDEAMQLFYFSGENRGKTEFLVLPKTSIRIWTHTFSLVLFYCQNNKANYSYSPRRQWGSSVLPSRTGSCLC